MHQNHFWSITVTTSTFFGERGTELARKSEIFLLKVHQNALFHTKYLTIFWRGGTAPPHTSSELGRGHPLPRSYSLGASASTPCLRCGLDAFGVEVVLRRHGVVPHYFFLNSTTDHHHHDKSKHMCSIIRHCN